MMVHPFSSYIKKNLNINPESYLLLGLSGGVDSMVMAQLFLMAEIQFEIAHCNFKLRGKASDMDEIFVRDFAKKHDLIFHSHSFNTSEISRKHGISVQMAARELRYDWFSQLMQQRKFDSLAIAHHKDDEYETVLFNLIKGTGLSGLTGWKSKKTQIIRPLLFANRNDIVEYAQINKIAWREDTSNTDTKYTRNKIRHNIIPVIKEINPGYLETYQATKVRLQENKQLFKSQLKKFRKRAVSINGNDTFISFDVLKKVELPTPAIYHVARTFGFNYKQCINIWDAIHQPGNIFISATHSLNVDRNELIISENKDPVIPRLIEKNTKKLVINGIELKFEIITDPNSVDLKNAKKNTAYIDMEKLLFPLHIKPVAKGDSFIPLGMTGKKKVSDFMIDEKIPVNLKSRVLTILSGNEIIWIVGHRIDNRYKITPDTNKVLCIKLVTDAD